MVKKIFGNWRLFVDFTNLNKACPKDAYPLPLIDQLIDMACGYKLLSFMDAYSRYNQILMNLADVSKTIFITDRNTYYYKVMPFGLKNAEETNQRLMDKLFSGQIGRNLEVCVDDMVVKTDQNHRHIEDLEETFTSIRKYNMRVNTEKCTLGCQLGNS